jgi:uncharacterized protein
MRCPDCRLDLVILEVDGVELDLCLDHHGVWFDHNELGQLFAQAGAGHELDKLEAELLADRPAGQTTSRASQSPKRRCPRCAIRLKQVCLAQGPVLDSCPRGHGLWFDPGEIQQLAQIALGHHTPGLKRVQAYLDHFFNPALPKS